MSFRKRCRSPNTDKFNRHTSLIVAPEMPEPNLERLLSLKKHQPSQTEKITIFSPVVVSSKFKVHGWSHVRRLTISNRLSFSISMLLFRPIGVLRPRGLISFHSNRSFHVSPLSLLFKGGNPANRKVGGETEPLPKPEIKPVAPITPKQSDAALEETYRKHPILKRVPRFLRPYTTQFIGAPVSHVTAFLILHEFTAIVPLVGLWYVFHQHHDLFMSASMDLPAWAIEKGTKVIDSAMANWDYGNYSLNDKVKFIMEGAYAYVIVKALFPIRLVFSLVGMPWFAKWFVLPFTKMFSRKAKPKSSTPVQTVKKVEKPML
ncbi:putative MIOREX complex component [Clavispora lusitaniae]|uniref:MIOREX complex component n=1 Tax=Clavispora lusitaniae TaxID=36911 RepID=A0ACD0WQJ5_CLALS|nr:putative MIOREX complex component [Clavispora lusitaniae]QFZ35472.1 putative MIOREX complex component [Clavispora lusitaniae]QFZ41166.1 putative MIOREX complex component [Clavispora lusitaniae]QFZ46847.1 putative MIOREX complex component [Clavispora lusitaniae]QFZ52512.1 putative MIOREX complex component [Clavispora lusitaniae]